MRNRLLFFATSFILALSLLLVGPALASDPSISITPDTSVIVLSGDSVRIWIYASDPDPGDTITVEKTYGTGTYDPKTDLAPLYDEFYFQPDTSGVYTFIFPVTDEYGATASDTTKILVCNVKLDFRQSANKDSPYPPGDVHWINSILQQSNSQYYEGMSTLQRIVFVQIPKTSGNVHTLTFSHQANKSTSHAYDFLTSWPQGVQAGTEIGGPTMFVNLNQCGPEIGPPSNMGAICSALHASGFTATPNAPDNMGTLLADNVASRVTAYEAHFGNRTVKIYGNTPVSSASIAFTGYSGSTDKYANYTLTWTSSSDSIVIEMAGHLAAGVDPVGEPGVGYGAGKGSANISGGPYHFKLGKLDGASLGGQDNQISGTDILCPPPVCNVTPSVDTACVGGSATFTDNTTNGTPPYTYCWTKRPYSGSCLSTTATLTISNATLADADSYRVIVTDANNLKDTCYAILMVGSPPTLTCAGDELTCDSTQASATVTSNPSEGVSYFWSPAPVSGQNTAHARYDTQGDKWVVVTITATGCKDSCKAVITQNKTTPTLTCKGDTLTCDSSLASATVTSNPSEGVSYFWSPAPVSGQNTAHARYDTQGDKWVVVTITATGCKDSCKAVITQNVTKPLLACPDTMRVHSGHHSSGNFTVNHPQGDSIVSINAWVSPSGTGITNLAVIGGTGRTPTTGHVEFDANCSYPGVYSICIEATDRCGLKDTCCFQVRVTNLPPQIVCPPDTSYGVGHFVSGNFTASDPEGQPVTVAVVGVSPPSDSMPYIVGSHVEWGITSGDLGAIYTITLVVTDECGATAHCSFQDTVGEIICGNVVWIPNSACVQPGDTVGLPILLKNLCNGVTIGGFELEVEFDYIDLTLLSVTRGQYLLHEFDQDAPYPWNTAHYTWEYFSYRLLPCPLCACCKYKILIYGQNDMPNGQTKLGYCLNQSYPEGQGDVPVPGGDSILVWLKFQVANNSLLRGLKLPVCFEWEDAYCTENTFSNCTGDTLWVSADTLSDGTWEFPPSCTTHQEYLGGAAVIWAMHFYCGGVDVCDTNSTFKCERGDVNLNHVAYEPADAVLFARYFVTGTSVFTFDEASQICATDVNADGRTLMLSDLIYLIRVIQHDATAYPKLGPSVDVANLIVSADKITVECASPIGGLLFEFAGKVNPTLLNANMEILSNENKVLVWSSAGHSINGASEILGVSGNLVSVIAVDREGRELNTTITSKVAPTSFALNPAYPNPFNPSTNLSFTLPTATAYKMSIYNVAGQLVRSYDGAGFVGLNVITWDGKDNSGSEVSSGVYFYKLIAGTFTATNKMVMMK